MLGCLVLCFGAAQVCKCLPTLGESERATNQGQAERVCCTATIYLLIASFTQTACLSGASGYAGAIKPDWHDSMTRKDQDPREEKKSQAKQRAPLSISGGFLLFLLAELWRPNSPGRECRRPCRASLRRSLVGFAPNQERRATATARRYGDDGTWIV